MHRCTALLKAELFIEPPPDTQRKGRRGERGIGVRFLIFSRKKVKIYEAANIWTGREYFGKSCWYNSRYSTAETPPI
jgi:hypothetical protein